MRIKRHRLLSRGEARPQQIRYMGRSDYFPLPAVREASECHVIPHRQWLSPLSKNRAVFDNSCRPNGLQWHGLHSSDVAKRIFKGTALEHSFRVLSASQTYSAFALTQLKYIFLSCWRRSPCSRCNASAPGSKFMLWPSRRGRWTLRRSIHFSSKPR